MEYNKKINTRIAVPTLNPGGFDAVCSPHFGRCECFTLIDIEDGKPKDSIVAKNPPHGHGDCLSPVELLVSMSVKKLIVRGIGLRPRIGFKEAGIDIYLFQREGTAKDAAEAFINGELPLLPDDFSCFNKGIGH